MAWYEVKLVGEGSTIPDGNNIIYPIALPSTENKQYVENVVNEIALAIDMGDMKIAQMPDAIRNIRSCGLIPTRLVFATSEYTSSDLLDPYPPEV